MGDDHGRKRLLPMTASQPPTYCGLTHVGDGRGPGYDSLLALDRGRVRLHDPRIPRAPSPLRVSLATLWTVSRLWKDSV